MTLCVVNDGSDRDLVEKIVRAGIPARIDLDFVHNAEAVGQVAALNSGFARVKREFLAVHDDDDSWAPDFLVKMTRLLRQPENARFIGAACRAEIVEEDVESDRIIFKESRVHHRYGPILSLFKLLHFYSHPPPIAVLMRRAVLDIVPANNPLMPVMYDCEWMVRVLMQADVVALDETLCFYHQRRNDRPELGPARNSVFEFGEEFNKLLLLVQNELLRDELRRGTLGPGFISSLNHFLHELSFPLNAETSHYLSRRARRYFRRRERIRKVEARLRRMAAALGLRKNPARHGRGG